MGSGCCTFCAETAPETGTDTEHIMSRTPGKRYKKMDATPKNIWSYVLRGQRVSRLYVSELTLPAGKVSLCCRFRSPTLLRCAPTTCAACRVSQVVAQPPTRLRAAAGSLAARSLARKPAGSPVPAHPLPSE